MKKKTIAKILIVLGLVSTISCATSDEQRGYRVFISDIVAEDVAGSGGGNITSLMEVDVYDCRTVEGSDPEEFFNVIVELEAIATINVEVFASSNFVNGLVLTLTHLVINYTPLDSIDPDNNPSLFVEIPKKTFQFGNDSGTVLNVGTDEDLELDVLVPFIDGEDKQRFANDVQVALDSVGSSDDGIAGLTGLPEYQIDYTFFTKDNFGNRTSTTVSGIMEIGNFGDDCGS